MRNTVLSVGLLVSAIFFITAKTAAAAPAQPFAITNDPLSAFAWQAEPAQEQKDTLTSTKDDVDTQKKKDVANAKAKAEEEAASKLANQPKLHTVAPSETLTKIADIYDTTWQRLYAKNIQVNNPDIVSVGQIITVPQPEEVLADRAIPVRAPSPPTPSNTPSSERTTSTPSRTYPKASSAGNTYAQGYCTWYAKSRRPDLPNRMGNASAWTGSAAARGFATGKSPRAGAIAQQGNHVAYVESVNSDGTVTLSEMNWRGLYVVSSRTTAAGNFNYIY